MIHEALAYAVRGWAIIPLHRVLGNAACSCGRPDCSSPGKHPVAHLVPNGLSNATRDPNLISRWWSEPWNIGIVTGAVSGLVVLDIDEKNDGLSSLKELQTRHGAFTATLAVYTGGGGHHYYFAHPGYPVANSAGRVAQGVDVRGDGGYVVAPPSNHLSGDDYEWQDSDAPILPMPAFVSPQGITAKATQPDELPGKIPEGQRNVTMISFAGSMRRRGAPANVILAALREMNDTMTHKPIPGWELERIVESVARYAPDEVITGIDDVVAEYDDGELNAVSMRELMTSTIRDVSERQMAGGGLIGLSYGFDRLDDMTGGAAKGELIVIGARPSMGKTAFALSLAKTMGFHARAAVFSAEMSAAALGNRWVSMESGIEGMRLRRGNITDAEMANAVRSAQRLSGLDIWVSDDSGTSPRGIRRTLASMAKRVGPAGVAFVDYLQLIRADSKHNNREEAVAEISRELKAIAKDFDIPVIALAQLNRAVESRRDKRPGLADFRESGQIEQDIDCGMFIHRAEYYGDQVVNIEGIQRSAQGVAEIIIAKQRNGPVGEVFLSFDADTATFSNYSSLRLPSTPTPTHYAA